MAYLTSIFLYKKFYLLLLLCKSYFPKSDSVKRKWIHNDLGITLIGELVLLTQKNHRWNGWIYWKLRIVDTIGKNDIFICIACQNSSFIIIPKAIKYESKLSM